MKYTNEHGLPEFVYDALVADTYEKVGDYSITELLKSPRQTTLAKRHGDDITIDVSERAFAALGTGVHHMFEVAEHDPDRWAVEKRCIHTVNDVQISGKSDLVDLENGILYDFKVCSVWTYIFGGQKDWFHQLNAYAWLLSKEGIEIKKASIISVYRDWKFEEKERDKQNNPFEPQYPASPITEIEIKLLPVDKIEKAMKERVALHVEANKLADGRLPLCTADERWARGEAYAVKKKGGKRAMNGGLKKTLEEAQAFANSQAEQTEIEHRHPKNIKCMRYCAAAPFCEQWTMLQQEGQLLG